MSRFDGKTVIVTGAAGALGTSMIRGFAAEGARAVAGARRDEPVTDLLAKQRFARPVSILVNNAAREIVGTTMSLIPDGFRDVIDTSPARRPSARVRLDREHGRVHMGANVPTRDAGASGAEPSRAQAHSLSSSRPARTSATSNGVGCSSCEYGAPTASRSGSPPPPT